MEKDWKKEFARDSLAFGSILFYFIVIIRAIIGEYMIFVYQLLISITITIILSYIVKNSNLHIARAFPLVVFTSLFYKDNLFTIFAILLFIFMLGSAYYIKIKKEYIMKGVVIGLIAAFGGYYLGLLLG